MTRPKGTIPRSCGDCRWLMINEASLTKHEPPRWKEGAGGSCSFPSERIIVPLSVSRYYAFRPDARSYCSVSQTGCPTWEPIPEEQP